MTTIRTVIHECRIEVPAPEDLPDGTEVILTIGTEVADDDGPMSPQEIARVLTAMGQMQPLEIPDEVAAGGERRTYRLRAGPGRRRRVVRAPVPVHRFRERPAHHEQHGTGEPMVPEATEDPLPES